MVQASERRGLGTPTTCWPWLGWTIPIKNGQGGYGQIRTKGKTLLVHRVVYEEFFGPIPVGMDLDHLCRNRRCYNPWHLEPVTRAENLRRGRAVVKVETHCPLGHRYDFPPMGSRERCASCRRLRVLLGIGKRDAEKLNEQHPIIRDPRLPWTLKQMGWTPGTVRSYGASALLSEIAAGTYPSPTFTLTIAPENSSQIYSTQ